MFRLVMSMRQQLFLDGLSLSTALLALEWLNVYRPLSFRSLETECCRVLHLAVDLKSPSRQQQRKGRWKKRRAVDAWPKPGTYRCCNNRSSTILRDLFSPGQNCVQEMGSSSSYSTTCRTVSATTAASAAICLRRFFTRRQLNGSVLNRR